ncbi:hypothetical protein ACLOJK_000668 [Asimina triloba]
MSFDASRSSHSQDRDSSKKTKRKSLLDSSSSKSRQKTLGMAWGSNSRASSIFSARKAPFANFGSYMEAKNRKLHHQFDADASTSSLGGSNVGNGLFHGISIFVDGFTVPSSQELREYMLKNGGRFENYFSRHFEFESKEEDVKKYEFNNEDDEGDVMLEYGDESCLMCCHEHCSCSRLKTH